MGPTGLLFLALLLVKLALAKSEARRIADEPCLQASVSTFYANKCVDRIWDLSEDANFFWFGNAWNATCSDAHEGDINCHRTDGNATLTTFGQRLFADEAFAAPLHLGAVSVPLDQGTFEPNRVKVQIPESSLLCYSTVVESERDFWFPSRDTAKDVGCGGPGGLCTLIFYDLDAGQLHNVWTNWPREEDFTNLNPPTPHTSRNATFAWLVMRQGNHIPGDLSPKKGRLPAPFSFKLLPFARKHGLQGPIALTLVEFPADPWSIGVHAAAGTFQNCPLLLEQQLEAESNSASLAWSRDESILAPNATLSIWMGLKFQRLALTWTICGQKHIRFANKLWLNPIENAFVRPEDVNGEPSLLLQDRKVRPTQGDFKERLFSIALLHIEKEMPERVFLHWLRIDFTYPQSPLNSSGLTLLSYDGTVSDTAALHTRQYYILLWEQERLIGARAFSWLRLGCRPQSSEKRCNFPLGAWTKVERLRLVGLSRFQVAEPETQPFTRARLMEAGLLSENECSSNAQTAISSMALILVLGILLSLSLSPSYNT